MTSLHKKQQGFTIIELLIVIVVIGILAALVITTYSGIQEKARDTSRQNDIRIVHQQLESYATQNGKYPSRDELNSSTFRTDNMKGVDADTYKDPKGSTDQFADTAGSKVYAYMPTPTGCDNTTTDCEGYTLTATLEGTIDGSNTYSKTGLQ